MEPQVNGLGARSWLVPWLEGRTRRVCDVGGSGGVDEPGALPEAALDRDFRLVALVVGLVSLITFAWLVERQVRGDLTQSRTFGDVFDLQARAMLQGHLAVPDGSLGFEGFVVDGQTYAYFGIFPSLLRIPLFLVTDRLDGRLTAFSMIVAYGVALWSATALVARTRALLRPGQAWTGAGSSSAASCSWSWAWART